MKKYYYIYIIALTLFFSCRESNVPFSDSSYSYVTEFGEGGTFTIDKIDIGEVRDLYFDNNRLFVATEDQGIYIYDINSFDTPNSIALSNGKYLETLYENILWGADKDMRRIHYSASSNLIFALDRFGYTYHGYLPYLIYEYEPNSIYCTPEDTLMLNACSTQSHGTAFIVDESNFSPELYILYKNNEETSSYAENPYSSVKFMEYAMPPSMTLDFCELFATCEDDAINIADSLSYNVNDMFYSNDKLYFANSNDEQFSFEIYNKGGGLLDEYVTDSEVKSIYAVNDFVLAGTRDGCYITLLEDSGISEDENYKLVLAEDYTIYDIVYDNGKLILTAGDDGILVYDWDGQSFNFVESLRIFTAYSYIARIFENSIFVATKEGLEIYNIEE